MNSETSFGESTPTPQGYWLATAMASGTSLFYHASLILSVCNRRPA